MKNLLPLLNLKNIKNSLMMSTAPFDKNNLLSKEYTPLKMLTISPNSPSNNNLLKFPLPKNEASKACLRRSSHKTSAESSKASCICWMNIKKKLVMKI